MATSSLIVDSWGHSEALEGLRNLSRIISDFGDNCQSLLDRLLRFLPGLRSCLKYSITVDGLTSHSCPGFIPAMIPRCNSHRMCLSVKPESFAAWAAVMYSSSGNQPSFKYAGLSIWQER